MQCNLSAFRKYFQYLYHYTYVGIVLSKLELNNPLPHEKSLYIWTSTTQLAPQAMDWPAALEAAQIDFRFRKLFAVVGDDGGSGVAVGQ